MNVQFITNLGQPAKLLSGGGQGREVWELYASGPKSYNTTTGDPVNGPSSGSFMSAPCGNAYSKSGTYEVQFIPVATNTLRPGWVARWMTRATTSVASLEVANATDLSAETIQFCAVGGEF